MLGTGKANPLASKLGPIMPNEIHAERADHNSRNNPIRHSPAFDIVAAMPDAA
jgi:hypothetical protein